jgi:hypothetical protein
MMDLLNKPACASPACSVVDGLLLRCQLHSTLVPPHILQGEHTMQQQSVLMFGDCPGSHAKATPEVVGNKPFDLR